MQDCPKSTIVQLWKAHIAASIHFSASAFNGGGACLHHVAPCVGQGASDAVVPNIQLPQLQHIQNDQF